MRHSVTDQLRALETNAEYFGISRLQLMEAAGHSVALEIASRFEPGKSVLVFCGLGGNGGDGFVAARHLLSMGYMVTVVLAGEARRITHEEALDNWKALRFLRRGMSVLEIHDASRLPKVTAEIVVDALLGVGVRGTLREPVIQLVRLINDLKAFRVSIDVPTGVDVRTGQILGEAVKADLVVTFHRSQPGLEKARDHIGDLIVKNVGLPAELEHLAGPGDVLLAEKPRPARSHKGDFGNLLVIGGSESFIGAPALSGMAALRCGVDLVHVAAPERTAFAISSLSPNLITVKLKGRQLDPSNLPKLETYIEGADAVIMGPGLGLNNETEEFIEKAVDMIEEKEKPLLLDADGIKAFSKCKRPIAAPSVLTPHAGEFATLTERKLSENLEERILEVRKAGSKLKSTILLKGPVDIVSDGSDYKLNITGNPAMTAGGTGDVLSGIAGALLAHGIDPFRAATAAAFVSGAAGDLVAENLGYHMVATDLLEWIPQVLKDPMRHKECEVYRAKRDQDFHLSC